ncbi:hypothetical protein [Capnocytophaga catalasegens]|uniref:Transcriptional regulator n=1 Tax=Capnocytophaga catalasegens TaxID=1004260 RepID=A0AAV5B0P5_9FLAO|nr:hypothetical protein [Capnocytophaga catalasegens]GIZ16643.1 hypothetical protein RCZ03_26430 [Capnocytophaga catalasegens]GJM51561.1 hypothetical protein RCZ15_25340 [Capnocytophaga catalasegens]GJM54343.1 hypothetical protein RCZ16_26590 [Capnocytophaga catalasegens]
MSKNLPTIKDRVLYFAEYKEVSKQEFFRKTGLNYSNFTGKSKESDLNSKSVAEILLIYDEINPMWLLTGNGSMLKENTPTAPPPEDTGQIALLQQENAFLKEKIHLLEENKALLLKQIQNLEKDKNK